MGVKSKAAVAIVVLLLFLGSLWLREYFCVCVHVCVHVCVCVCGFYVVLTIYTIPPLFEMHVLPDQECVTW